MTDKKQTTDPEKLADKFGADEVKDKLAEAQEQGFFGTQVDQLPNSAHSLESGPDSPTVAEQAAANKEA